jgi:pimeloyl-ACP methyl ester carboxylesterase
MRFYSGFCLRNESDFFKTWLRDDDYTVAGFSYGAIRATEYAANASERIERLQLFSPAYFCNKSEGFRKLQLKGYRCDSEAYREKFLQSCFAPYPATEVETEDDGIESLETLLYYDWPDALLRSLHERGVRIEVYVGEKDAVIDSEAAKDYFTDYATVYYLKNANHFLQGERL